MLRINNCAAISSGIELSITGVTAKHIPVCYFGNRFNVRPLVMSASQQTDTETASLPYEAFNGAELSESVLARDWITPEEDAAWSNL
jgi:hypothetical protein